MNRDKILAAIKDFESQLEALRTQVMDTSVPWEPNGENWIITGDGYHYAGDSHDKGYTKFGTTFETEEEAIAARNAYRDYHRLYKLQQELDDGWFPDWTDSNQRKFSIRTRYSNNEHVFSIHGTFSLQHIYGIYFQSFETATKAIEILKSST